MNAATEGFSLQGRSALVIGGGSGIGREIALGYRRAGAKVLLAGRRAERLLAVAEELRAAAGPADGSAGDGPRLAYPADARASGALAELAATVAADHGTPDILVNCQGTTAIKPALELSEAEYDTILDTNLKSVFFACTAFAPGMLARGDGRIVNITSLAAHTGWANAAAYSASKWGVAGITQSLAAEWGEGGVRVNAIAPGFFMTELNRERMPEARKAEARRRSAMRRMGELSELVGAAIFLASDAAAFVNGATLRVDGGYLASGI
ncbi:SDR family NAD(P)-dependent oxidoreductase [Marinibaculum pumilum]|uniref:SDR family NAD(P)-dependent oxidoreductase n=1 Tax=Marinibaculum pumilum TaxID=1766165 RepID=A0ABV7L7T1_9PROT